ncbi:MAG TPA: MraY family glycosyltransferase [Armatimonadota bacterium]|nr:MraY family glycosyltransferase [Armatimonadota bacterium]
MISFPVISLATTHFLITSQQFELVALSLLIALVIALAFTPLTMKLAVYAGVMDRPQARRVHTKPTPRWGGLAMFSAFVLTVFALAPIRHYVLHEPIGTILNRQVIGVLIGGVIMTTIGALDDKYNVPAKLKLLGQICAAIVLVLPIFGVRFMVAFNVDLNHYFWLGSFLTVLWVVAVTNTINLIDGLDGLAAGISGIAALTFVIISVAIKGTFGEALLAAAVLGACLGFLRYNFHPAKVFMGDAGSHFLGFTIAALSILQNWKVATGVAFAVPMLILAVPIFDTAFAIIRRLRRGQPIFSPDKGHLHHRLLGLGLGQRSVVLTIYALTAIGCALALLLTRTAPW